MQRAAAAWAAEHTDAILGPPEVQGITDFGATDVRVRVVVMVKPGLQQPAERELRRRLLAAFQTEGIALTSAVVTVATARPPS